MSGMSFPYTDSVDFGSGPSVAASASVDLLDTGGDVIESLSGPDLIDLGGGMGRKFGFTFAVPDDLASGTRRARDGGSPEQVLPDLGIDFLFDGAGPVAGAGFPLGLIYPGTKVTVGFTLQGQADALPTGSVLHAGAADLAVPVLVSPTGPLAYSAAFTVPSGYGVGTGIALLIDAQLAGVPGGAVVLQGVVGAVPVPDRTGLTIIQRQYMADMADVVRLTTDYDGETEQFQVIRRLVPYMHVPTRNLEDFTEVGRQITENIETTDHGLFPEGAVIASDAYLVNRSGPNPRTGIANRLNGLFFRVLGPVQPFPSSSSGYADEAMYELRYDEHPHPDLTAATGD
jgi:hypothetical protein